MDDIVIENNLFAVPQTAKSIAADVLVVSSVFEGKPLPIDFFSAVEAEKSKQLHGDIIFTLMIFVIY